MSLRTSILQGGEGVTFPALLRSQASRLPAGVAFVEKRLGIWRPVTWKSFADDVAASAHGLRSLGVGEGDGVAIMAKPCSEWFIIDLAAQSIGAVSIGLYATTPAEELGRILETTAPSVLVLEDEEHVDYVVQGLGRGTGSPAVVYLSGSNNAARSFADLKAEGHAERAKDPGSWDRWVESRRSDEPLIGVLSSGTTQAPRVAVHTSGGIIDSLRYTVGAAGLGESGRRERVVADAPLAHPVGRSLAIYLPLIIGSLTYVPDTEQAAASAAIEVRPTVAYVSPVRLAALGSRISAALGRSGWFRRSAVNAACRLRARAMEQRSNGRRVDMAAWAMAKLGYVMACRQILDRFGYVKVKVAFTGGSPVGQALLEEWTILGLPVRRIYALAEGVVLGVETASADRDGWFTTPSSVDTRTTPSGELEIAGPGVCVGFFEGGGVRAITRAWLPTGDIVELDAEGRVRVIDRAANVLSIGDRVVHRAHVEQVLIEAPHIQSVHVFEGGAGCLVALVELDVELVNMWVTDAGRRITSLGELATDPEVRSLVAGHVARANRELSAQGLLPIEDFRILTAELDPEDGGTMTPTGNLRREAVEQRFAAIVAELRGTFDEHHDAREQAENVLR